MNQHLSPTPTAPSPISPSLPAPQPQIPPRSPGLPHFTVTSAAIKGDRCASDRDHKQQPLGRTKLERRSRVFLQNRLQPGYPRSLFLWENFMTWEIKPTGQRCL